MSRRLQSAYRLFWGLILVLGVCLGTGRAAMAQSALEQQIEQQVLVLTNQFRAQHGLSQLRTDARLVACARAHSDEMIRLSYFSHRSPTAGYVTVADRGGAAGITDLACGENLASMRGYAPSQLPQAAMTGWINSPGHLANLMRSSYTHVGIGVVIRGNQCMITSNFGEPLLVYNNGTWTPASTNPHPAFTPTPAHTVPPRTSSATSRQIEDKLLALTNQARKDAGLSPLSPDNRLRQAAIDHDAEMLALHYFSHTSPTPDHATVEDRVHFYGVNDMTVYENIAQMRGYASTGVAEAAFKGFMDSDANRENVLKPGATGVGVGVVASQGTAMICVLFGEPSTRGYVPFERQVWDTLWAWTRWATHGFQKESGA